MRRQILAKDQDIITIDKTEGKVSQDLMHQALKCVSSVT